MNFHDILTYDADTGLFRWKVSQGRAVAGAIVGTRFSKGYLRFKTGGHHYFLHRVAWMMTYGRWPDGFIDHINGNTSDNRISNLRECSMSENICNQKVRSDSGTGMKGVNYRKNDQRYVAYVNKDGKRHYLGSFVNAEDAYSAATKARSDLHGEFARHG